MNSPLKSLVVAVFLLSLFGTSAHAAPITYQLFVDVPFYGLSGGFTYTSPDFITGNIHVSPSALDEICD